MTGERGVVHVRAGALVNGCVWDVEYGVYEVHYFLTHDPTFQHGFHRPARVPAHLSALRDSYEAALPLRMVHYPDGDVALTPRIRCIAVRHDQTEVQVAAFINVGYYAPDGTLTAFGSGDWHRLNDQHESAHRTHVARVQAALTRKHLTLKEAAP